MDLIDEIKVLSATALRLIDQLKTEEATKLALVAPFIKILGYNVFDPAEIVPEFSADFGTSIADKVDYTVFMDGKPVMLFECKWAGKRLEKKDEDQLRKYFAACPSVRISVLTNGHRYAFFTDVEKTHLMDDRPFLEFDLLDVKAAWVEELKRFTKAVYDPENVTEIALQLKYTKGIKRRINEEFTEPSEEFVKLLARDVYSGKKIMPKMLEFFTTLARTALKQYLEERIEDTIKKAIQAPPPPPEPIEPKVTTVKPEISEEEREGFHLIRSLLYEVIAVDHITLQKKKGKDGRDYLNIRLDENFKKPICRLYLNEDPKGIGLWEQSESGKGEENREEISGLVDLYQYATRLKAIVLGHETPKIATAGLGPDDVKNGVGDNDPAN